MRRKDLSLNNYVPFSVQQDGKDDPTCRIFHEDLAVLDTKLHVLAARGLLLHAGDRLALPETEQRFLYQALGTDTWIALQTNLGILTVHSGLLSVGLLPVLLPHGEAHETAGALTCLAKHSRCSFSPAVCEIADSRNVEAHAIRLQGAMRTLEELMPERCNRSLHRQARRIADFAGCRLQIPEAWDVMLAVTPHTHAKRIAFLLCSLLTLREASASSVTMQATVRNGCYRLILQAELPSHLPDCATLFQFLERPPFSDCTVASDRNYIRLEYPLTIPDRPSLLMEP